MTLTEIEARIAAVLEPLLGQTMAKGAVRSQCMRLKIPGEPTSDDIERLLQALGTGLNVFVGKVKSAQLIEQLREELCK